jgi:hypothetical protein
MSFEDVGGQTCDIFIAGDVDHEGPSNATNFLNLFDDGLGPCGVNFGNLDDAAMLGEQSADGTADSGSPTGDDDHLVL